MASTETARAERWVVIDARGEIARIPWGVSPWLGTYFGREDAELAFCKIGAGRLVHLVEIHEDEQIVRQGQDAD